MPHDSLAIHLSQPFLTFVCRPIDGPFSLLGFCVTFCLLPSPITIQSMKWTETVRKTFFADSIVILRASGELKIFSHTMRAAANANWTFFSFQTKGPFFFFIIIRHQKPLVTHQQKKMIYLLYSKYNFPLVPMADTSSDVKTIRISSLYTIEIVMR